MKHQLSKAALRGLQVSSALTMMLLVWILVSATFPIDKALLLRRGVTEAYYSAARAFLGSALLFVLSLAISPFLDRSHRTTDTQVASPSPERPLPSSQEVQVGFLAWIVLGIRLASWVYFGLFLFYLVVHSWFADLPFILGSTPAFELWPVFLVASWVSAGYLIVSEPWWPPILLLESQHKAVRATLRTPSTSTAPRTITRIVPSIMRMVIYLILYSFAFLFASARFPDNARNLHAATLAFLLLALALQIVNRRATRTGSAPPGNEHSRVDQ